MGGYKYKQQGGGYHNKQQQQQQYKPKPKQREQQQNEQQKEENHQAAFKANEELVDINHKTMNINQNSKFFVIKSYSEDNIIMSIKYNKWSSTQNGNEKLNKAFVENNKQDI